MTDPNAALVVRKNNQAEYLAHLRLTGYQYAYEFNSENPNPDWLRQADLLEKGLNKRAPNDASLFLAIGGSLWLAVMAALDGTTFKHEIPYWAYALPVGALVLALVTKKQPVEMVQDTKSRITSLRQKHELQTYHEDFFWRYKGTVTTFRFIFHITRHNLTNDLQQRVKHDVELIFHQFTQNQTALFNKNNYDPSACNWDTGPIECLFLPAFILTAHDFSITVFRFRIMVTPPTDTEGWRGHDVPVSDPPDHPGTIPRPDNEDGY